MAVIELVEALDPNRPKRERSRRPAPAAAAPAAAVVEEALAGDAPDEAGSSDVVEETTPTADADETLASEPAADEDATS